MSKFLTSRLFLSRSFYITTIFQLQIEQVNEGEQQQRQQLQIQHQQHLKEIKERSEVTSFPPFLHILHVREAVLFSIMFMYSNMETKGAIFKTRFL